MKTSIPKLHSIRWKGDGHLNENVAVLDVERKILPYDVLVGAYLEDLREIVLIGYDQNGREFIAGSSPDVQRAQYLFQRGSLAMLRMAD